MNSLENQPGHPLHRSGWQRRRAAILQTLAMILAAAVLLFFTWIITPAPCWAVFVLVAFLAFPIWHYRTEYLLFRRRLVLAGAARPESRVRAFLWKGGVTRAMQVIVSALLAWVLLALASRLSPMHWVVLAVDGLFLSLIAGPVTRWLKTDIQDRHRGIIARRWPLFLVNGVVLSAALMMIDFFMAGAVDTRHLAWSQVAEQAFIQVNGIAGCRLWGVSAGALASLEALGWHLSELVIPNLPDVAAKGMAWLFFLLRAVAVAWIYTALLLGIRVLLDKRAGGRDRRKPESLFSRSFLLTIIILALPFFYASIKLNEVRLNAAVQPVTGPVVTTPCKPGAVSRAQLITRLDAAVAVERQGALDEIDAGIDQGLEPVFADVEAGVESYLDWYFTVTGEYQRLAAVFSDDVMTTMAEKLEEHLFADNGFAARLEVLDNELGQVAVERFANLAPVLGTAFDKAACGIGGVDLSALAALDRDNLRASAAVASGVGAGIVASKVLAKKTAAVVIGKVAAKKSFQAGAAVVSKTLAKKGASTALSAGLGATLCAPAGPLAILCGVAAGVATWLAVDKALVELDESLNREEMHADIMMVLAEQRALLKEQLREEHYARVDRLAERVNAAVQRTFVPYRDGM